jgi:hypothetical protein
MGWAARRRGLAIVAAISSDWGITLRDGGAKSVWASFDVVHGAD